MTTYTLTEAQRQQLLDVCLADVSKANSLATQLLQSLTPNTNSAGAVDRMTTSNCMTCKYGGSWCGDHNETGYCYMFKKEPEGVCAKWAMSTPQAAPSTSPTIKQSLTVAEQSAELDAGAAAQHYCRGLWGAARGHSDWRKVHDAFVAGYSQGRYDELQAQGPNPWSDDALVVHYARGYGVALSDAEEAIDDECRERVVTARDCIEIIRNLVSEPVVNSGNIPQAAPSASPITQEKATALAHRIATTYTHRSAPGYSSYAFVPHTLMDFVRAIERNHNIKGGA